MPIPKKGSIPGRKKPGGLGDLLGGLGDLLGGTENLLGSLLVKIVKGLGKTIEEVQNLNLEDLGKLAGAQGNEEAKRNIKKLEEALGDVLKDKKLDLNKLFELAKKHGTIQSGIRGHILGIPLGGKDLPLDRRTPTEKFEVKRQEPKVQKIKKKSKSEEEMRQPNLDVFDEKDHILIIGDMPGVNKEDIKYELKEKTLRIYTEAGRKYEKEIELPASVTKKVDLKYNNGVLELTLAKKKTKE